MSDDDPITLDARPPLRFRPMVLPIVLAGSALLVVLFLVERLRSALDNATPHPDASTSIFQGVVIVVLGALALVWWCASRSTARCARALRSELTHRPEAPTRSPLVLAPAPTRARRDPLRRARWPRVARPQLPEPSFEENTLAASRTAEHSVIDLVFALLVVLMMALAPRLSGVAILAVAVALLLAYLVARAKWAHPASPDLRATIVSPAGISLPERLAGEALLGWRSTSVVLIGATRRRVRLFLYDHERRLHAWLTLHASALSVLMSALAASDRPRERTDVS